MTQPWIPEIDVTVKRARLLIEGQYPELAPARVEPFGVGWDNTAYLVNEQYVFRFPHRRVAAGFMEAELAVLPHLAPVLPLPVPDPFFAGHPTDAYPWPFGGYRLLPGRAACAAGLDDRARARMAEPLGHFLACLHALPVKLVYNLGIERDLFGRIDPAQRLPKTRAAVDQLYQLGLISDLESLTAAVDDDARWYKAAQEAPAPSLVLAHGDLYASNLLVDETDALCGVIDWGNVHAGRVAADLMGAHLLLPPAAHAAFGAAYGPISEVDWHEARLRAVYHASVTALSSHEMGEEGQLCESLTSLRYIASG